MPLCWAHAEYVSLVHSRHAGYPLERIPEAWQRYVANPTSAPTTAFWSLAHRTREVSRGTRLLVMLDAPARIRWRTAGLTDWEEISSHHLFARLHLADLGPLTAALEFRLGADATAWSVQII